LLKANLKIDIRIREDMEKIETQRLTLISASPTLLSAAIKGDDELSQILEIEVVKRWTAFGVQALEYTLVKINSDPKEIGWWMYFPILKAENKLIGSGGFKGPPEKDGIVEIGYEINEHFRNQGLATEFAERLILHAFSIDQVQEVIAHTLAYNNASTKVLRKAGMKKVAELFDGEEGQVWRWSIKRSSAE